MSVRILVLLCVSFSGAACHKDAAFGPEDEAAILAVLHAQQEAWNAGNVEAFMEGYHRRPDVVFTSSARIRRGWEETLTAYRTRYVEGDAKMGALSFSGLEVQPLVAEAAVVLGRWALSETPQAGEGVFTLVFTEADGHWGILHDHSSAASDDS